MASRAPGLFSSVADKYRIHFTAAIEYTGLNTRTHGPIGDCFVGKNAPESRTFRCCTAQMLGSGIDALHPIQTIDTVERMIMRISHQGVVFAATLSGALLACTAAQADQQAFHRAYSGAGGDHFYTTSVAEIANAAVLGYAYEGVACNLVTNNDALAAGPLYRAFSPGQIDHFYTANFNELINAITNLGYQYEGISGYLVNSGQDFYRAYSGGQGDHFYTKSVAEWLNAATSFGYTLEGSAGKVL